LIGVDTNVLVRYLVEDDAAQAEEAALFLQTRCSTETPAFVNRIVVAELVWVLGRVYRYPRELIADNLALLLRTRTVLVEDGDDVARALELYRDGADLTDALIGLSNTRRGCTTTVTFDRRARRLREFNRP
jgi:predicted nucleic-acid-binding protein